MKAHSIKHDILQMIKSTLETAAVSAGLGLNGEIKANVEVPNEKSNGDFSSNLAMMLAKKAGMNPRTAAAAIISALPEEIKYSGKVEVAGPGFINFYLTDDYLYDGLAHILEAGNEYGSIDEGCGKKVMVEYVSANPTGPLHMGNARGGALGDLIASVFEKAGYDVTREYLINDAGNQIDKFSKSLEARYIQHLKGPDAVLFPEDGYQGEDITASAVEFAGRYGDKYLNTEEQERQSALTAFALQRNLGSIKAALEGYGIVFDSWFSEQRMIDSGELDETIRYLDEKGYTYEMDGAKWFRTSQFGCEKDDVIVRNNGIPTYFASDIAYHRDKFIKRGFDRVINLLGADHHGHVARMYAACRALGVEEGRLKIVVFQLVRLIRNGETARMSKRTGKAISLEDLIEEAGRDAVRFFFNMKASGSHLDFDIDLAAKQSNENPVFYVQYAHARISSILRKVEEEAVSVKVDADLRLLSTPEEKKLIDRLIDYPEEIRISASTLEPSRLTRYAADIASCFHAFYNACRVIGEDSEMTAARLSLTNAVKIVLGNLLELMKISAPDRM